MKNRYGLSICCTYVSSPSNVDQTLTLNGTYNDANHMRVLMESYGYSVIFMNDVDLTPNQVLYPTRDNILNQLQIILNRALKGDDVFIYYAGHGVNLLKRVGYDYEESGTDEAIVPTDFVFDSVLGFDNVIVDDMINDHLRLFSRAGVRILMMFDCCHSGTICDLKFTYKYDPLNRKIIFDMIPDKYLDGATETLSVDHNSIKADVITISGCGDSDVSTEAIIRLSSEDDVVEQGVLTGAFRYLFKQNSHDVFYLLIAIHTYISKFNQFPRVSSNRPLHLNPAYRSILNFYSL